MISPSNIIETGYSQGNRFILQSNKQPYSGPYFKDNEGNYYTGQTYTSSSQKLIDTQPPFNVSLDFLNKNNPVNTGFTKRFNESLEAPLLVSDFIKPNFSDYSATYFTRYFAQLKSSSKPEANIYELNKANYDILLSNSIALKFYNTIAIPWKIHGPLSDTFVGNVKIEDGVRDTNLRVIQQAEKTIKNLSLYLSDPVQFGVFVKPSERIYGVPLPITTVRVEIDLTPATVPVPTPSVTPTISETPSITPSITPTISVTPTVTPSITVTPSVTPSITITSTPTRTPTITPTNTPSETPSVTITPTETPTPSITRTPNQSVSVTPSPTRSPFPTRTPTVTPTISVTPSITPTVTPSITITSTPSTTPSVTVTPSETISATPSVTPTVTLSPTPTVGTSPTPTPSPSTLYCGSTISYNGGEAYPSTRTIFIGPIIGTVNLTYNAQTVPDRFIMRYESSIVIDTGFVGTADYDYGGINRTSFNNSLTGKIDPATSLSYPNAGVSNAAPDGYPYVSAVSSGTTSFAKNTTSTTVEVDVYAPFPGTLWSYVVGCVIPPTPSNTPSPTVTPTVTPTLSPTPSETPTLSPTPSITPSETPTVTPSKTPTITPSKTPSETPSVTLTSTPSITPTSSVTPTVTPTLSPTPSETPSITPSETPTVTPTVSTGSSPSATPTVTPTISETPSVTLSETPSITPSNTSTPSETPSNTPSITPTRTPSLTPSETPSITPSTSELVCNGTVSYSGGQNYPTTRTIRVGTTTGLVNLTYNAISVPDRFIMRFDGNIVIDTGYRGTTSEYNPGGIYRSSFINSLTGKVDPVTLLTYPNAGVTDAAPDGYPFIMGAGSGVISFNKTTATEYVYVDVYGPTSGTAWTFNVACPIPPSLTPSPTVSFSNTPSVSMTPSTTPSISLTPSITPSLTPTPTPPCISVTSLSVEGGNILNEPVLDITICLSSAVSQDTYFSIATYTANGYGSPRYSSVIVYAGQQCGNVVDSYGFLDNGSPIVDSFCIDSVYFGDANLIYIPTQGCNGWNGPCSGTPAPSLTPTPSISITPSITPTPSEGSSPSVTPSLTPTPSSVSYDVYLADKYDCIGCTLIQSNVLVALPSGTTVNFDDYYVPTAGSGEQGVYTYKITSSSSGAGLILESVSVGSCVIACSIA